MSNYKEGSIVSIKNKPGMYLIEQAPLSDGMLYVVHEYNDKYHLLYVKESDILPVPPYFCYHQWKLIDIGLGARNEIRYCTICGLKFDDLERVKL